LEVSVILFLRALFALFAYDILSAVSPFKTIYTVAKRWPVARKRYDDGIVDRICTAVNYACIWYPKPALCLQRSFVTSYLLRRHGVAADMVLGAQKIPFKAHAWVEVDGTPINERSNVQATYTIWDRC